MIPVFTNAPQLAKNIRAGKLPKINEESLKMQPTDATDIPRPCPIDGKPKVRQAP
jgi:hypothetical protein